MERWVIYAIISMLFAGLTSVLAKSGLKGISSDLGLAIRTAVVFILITLNVTVFTGVKDFSNLTKNNLIFLALSGLTTSLSWIFYYRAMKGRRSIHGVPCYYLERFILLRFVIYLKWKLFLCLK